MKYLGGKQRLGKYIAPFLKELIQKYEKNNGKLDGYLEPFCGSLGVLKNMVDIGMPIYANDNHPDLIEMWNEVKLGTFEYPESISEEEYNAAKKIPSPSAYKSFVGFGMSFGGRYFGAYSQKYLNGKNEDFCKEMVNSLKRIGPLIKDVTFTNEDFFTMNPENMLIYCDPPYEHTKYPIKYRRDVKKYDVFDNKAFWEKVKELSKKNLVIVSETSSGEEFIEIWKKEMYRSAAQSEKTRFNKESETHNIEKLFIHKSLQEKIKENS